MDGLLTGFSAFDHDLRVLVGRLRRVTLDLCSASHGLIYRTIHSALRSIPRHLFALLQHFSHCDAPDYSYRERAED